MRAVDVVKEAFQQLNNKIVKVQKLCTDIRDV